MKHPFCMVHTSADKRLIHSQVDTFETNDVSTFLPWAIASLDQQILRTLADSALAVDELTITFKFHQLVPRVLLSKLWIKAVNELSEIVKVLPEDDLDQVAKELILQNAAKRPRPAPRTK